MVSYKVLLLGVDGEVEVPIHVVVVVDVVGGVVQHRLDNVHGVAVIQQ